MSIKLFMHEGIHDWNKQYNFALANIRYTNPIDLGKAEVFWLLSW